MDFHGISKSEVASDLHLSTESHRSSMLIPISLYPSLGWFLLWPSVSCGLVAFGYLWAGPAVFRRNDGELTWPTRLLLGPVLAAQWLSWRYYSRESNCC